MRKTTGTCGNLQDGEADFTTWSLLPKVASSISYPHPGSTGICRRSTNLPDQNSFCATLGAITSDQLIARLQSHLYFPL